MENISAIAAIEETSFRGTATQLDIGYGASLTDIANFESSLNSAQENAMKVKRTEGPSVTEQAMAKPLDYINREAKDIVEYAKSAVESGNELSPGEIVMLSARTHEFMFHCQLTSNIANRTSDGLQQLFRQQS
jgi:hypothetical protein